MTHIKHIYFLFYFYLNFIKFFKLEWIFFLSRYKNSKFSFTQTLIKNKNEKDLIRCRDFIIMKNFILTLSVRREGKHVTEWF